MVKFPSSLTNLQFLHELGYQTLFLLSQISLIICFMLISSSKKSLINDNEISWISLPLSYYYSPIYSYENINFKFWHAPHQMKWVFIYLSLKVKRVLYFFIKQGKEISTCFSFFNLLHFINLLVIYILQEVNTSLFFLLSKLVMWKQY